MAENGTAPIVASKTFSATIPSAGYAVLVGLQQHLADKLTHSSLGTGFASIAKITTMLHGGCATVARVAGGVVCTVSIIIPQRF